MLCYKRFTSQTLHVMFTTTSNDCFSSKKTKEGCEGGWGREKIYMSLFKLENIQMKLFGITFAKDFLYFFVVLRNGI